MVPPSGSVLRVEAALSFLSLPLSPPLIPLKKEIYIYTHMYIYISHNIIFVAFSSFFLYWHAIIIPFCDSILHFAKCIISSMMAITCRYEQCKYMNALQL